MLVALAALDLYVGREQERILVARKELRARLDRMAFFGVRTGIDDIRYDPPSAYHVRFRIQNALDEPLYVMLPIVTAFVQVGAGWTEVAVAAPAAGADEGSVVKLVEEREFERVLTIDLTEYMELIPGYVHLKLNLEAYVSPEENPREEVGERHEDIFIYLKDGWKADVVARAASAGPAKKPAFIPLRAWTLIPKPAGQK